MKLAVFGGDPRFEKKQPVGLPLVEDETLERYRGLMGRVFANNFFTNDGPMVRRFEEALAERFRVGQAVAMANATLAQMLLMRAMGIDSGWVLVSANTFIATAHVCEWAGAKPYFCDVDPLTLNLDPREIERLTSPDVKAVIPTHVFGVIADLPAIAELAAKRGMRVIADAAHAFDCERDGIRPGGFDVPEFLSFHATKFFSTFEGGAVLTNDASLAGAMRELRNFGFAGYDNVTALGINAKMNEASAAFGLASLPALEGRRERLKAVHDRYRLELAGLPGLRIHDFSAVRTNHRYFAVFVEEGYGVRRDALCEILWRENVLARRYFYPGCHRMRYYAEKTPGGPAPLPKVEASLDSILCLPTSFDGIDDLEGAARIAEVLRRAHDEAKTVAEWWRKERA